MPVVPVCLLEPLWDQFSALLPEHPVVSPTHPLGCHRRRIPDRTVFEHVIAALVHGSGYERIASPGCSDATIRRRLKEWAAAGLSEQVQLDEPQEAPPRPPVPLRAHHQRQHLALRHPRPPAPPHRPVRRHVHWSQVRAVRDFVKWCEDRR